jgi:hypothetical protein
MSETKTYPTDEAWDFFMKHKDDIRARVDDYLPERPQSMNGPFGKASSLTIADFDAAVTARDSRRLTVIMENAWLRAPEDREVYRIPGFGAMCDLLDGTVDGFTNSAEPFDENDDPDEAAF